MPWPVGPQLPHAPYSLSLAADSTPGVSIHTYTAGGGDGDGISLSGGVPGKQPTDPPPIRAPALLAVASSITLLLLSLLVQELAVSPR